METLITILIALIIVLLYCLINKVKKYNKYKFITTCTYARQSKKVTINKKK